MKQGTGLDARRRATKRRSSETTWDLRLYVAGQSPKCVAALNNLRALCEEHLAGRYRIEIIDLLEKPQLARGDQVVAIPTVVRKLPAPVKRLIGALADRDRTLLGLDLRAGA